MRIRALTFGIGLLAVGAGSAYAQGLPPGPNSAPTDKPSIDGTRKTPDKSGPLPEVMKAPESHGDVLQPRTTEDASSVLRPPDVDPNMQTNRGGALGAVPK